MERTATKIEDITRDATRLEIDAFGGVNIQEARFKLDPPFKVNGQKHSEVLVSTFHNLETGKQETGIYAVTDDASRLAVANGRGSFVEAFRKMGNYKTDAVDKIEAELVESLRIRDEMLAKKNPPRDYSVLNAAPPVVPAAPPTPAETVRSIIENPEKFREVMKSSAYSLAYGDDKARREILLNLAQQGPENLKTEIIRTVQNDASYALSLGRKFEESAKMFVEIAQIMPERADEIQNNIFKIKPDYFNEKQILIDAYSAVGKVGRAAVRPATTPGAQVAQAAYKS